MTRFDPCRATMHRMAGPPWTLCIIGSSALVDPIHEAGDELNGSIRKHDAEDLAIVFWTMIKGLAIHRAAFGKEFKAPDPRVLTHFFMEAER